MELKVVSWNLHNKIDAWNYLFNEFNPHIGLLQESPQLPSDYDTNLIISKLVKQNLRNTIYTGNLKQQLIEIDEQYEIGLLSSKVTVKEDLEISLISIYGNLSFTGILDQKIIESVGIYLETIRKNNSDANIIIAGDFNMDRRMDENPTKTRFSKKGERVHNEIFDSIINFGFSDCLRKFHPDFIQTYRHYRNRENYPWELDHMFATKKLYDSLQKVEVHFNEAIEKVSDHNPIVAEFDL